MSSRSLLFFVPAVLVACCLAGCDDSKRPLSDPAASKADPRLAGVWRHRGEQGQTTYYHIGGVGKKLPGGVMGVITVTHNDGKLQEPGQLLLFPTTIGKGRYLNVCGGSKEIVEQLEQKGWDDIDGYFLMKYQIEGDVLTVWPMDGEAKVKAIESGRVKGEIEKQKFGRRVRFTDSTENLARFFADEGDRLFATEPVRMERVK